MLSRTRARIEDDYNIYYTILYYTILCCIFTEFIRRNTL